ncbi:unnamed protein product [Lampetra fluviatilis]
MQFTPSAVKLPPGSTQRGEVLIQQWIWQRGHVHAPACTFRRRSPTLVKQRRRPVPARTECTERRAPFIRAASHSGVSGPYPGLGVRDALRVHCCRHQTLAAAAAATMTAEEHQRWQQQHQRWQQLCEAGHRRLGSFPWAPGEATWRMRDPATPHVHASFFPIVNTAQPREVVSILFMRMLLALNDNYGGKFFAADDSYERGVDRLSGVHEPRRGRETKVVGTGCITQSEVNRRVLREVISAVKCGCYRSNVAHMYVELLSHYIHNRLACSSYRACRQCNCAHCSWAEPPSERHQEQRDPDGRPPATLRWVARGASGTASCDPNPASCPTAASGNC